MKLHLTGKCSDLCNFELVNDGGEIVEKDGYVPRGLGIGGGDYVTLNIDLKTGQILNWNGEAAIKTAEELFNNDG